MFRVVIGIVRLLLVSIPRLVLWAGIFLLSIIGRWVGKIGARFSFQSVAYLPLRLLVSPTDARMLRNDLMTAMDGPVEILITQHFGEGHARELMARNLKKRLEQGDLVKRRRYSFGEFGLSLGFTAAAVSIAYFRAPPSLTNAISLGIAIASLILLLSVGIRTALIDLLEYDGPSNGSLTENTKRFVWNGPVLSQLYPLTTLLISKTAAISDDFYRATAYSFGVAWEQSMEEETGFSKGFADTLLPEVRHILRDEDLSEAIPPVEEFEYIAD